MATGIPWTDVTLNVSTGCTKCSRGCSICFAERETKRKVAQKCPKYRNGFNFTTHDDVLEQPYHWKKPRLVFVNSMSDFFHEEMPVDFMLKAFKVMTETPRHTYQLLTKRAERMAELSTQFNWTPNIWAGVTIEHNDYVHRADCLRNVPAALRYLSLEPLLGPLPDLNLEGIGWVILGGESGSGFRPMDASWARDIRDRCIAAKIPFFFKTRSISAKT